MLDQQAASQMVQDKGQCVVEGFSATHSGMQADTQCIIELGVLPGKAQYECGLSCHVLSSAQAKSSGANAVGTGLGGTAAVVGKKLPRRRQRRTRTGAASSSADLGPRLGHGAGQGLRLPQAGAAAKSHRGASEQARSLLHGCS